MPVSSSIRTSVRKARTVSLGCLLGILFTSLAATGAKGNTQESVTLASDLWCPYTCASDKLPGYVVEVLEEIFENRGIEFTYLIMDWEEAVEKTRYGQYGMVAATARNEVPGFIFGHTSIGMARGAFFVPAGSSWTYTGLSSLRGIHLGVVDGYSYGWVVDGIIKRADELGVTIHSARGGSPLADNLRLLANGELDAVVGTREVILYTAELTGLTNRVRSAGGSLFEIPVFVGFSPEDPMASRNAQLVDQGIKQLRASGRLREILETYGLQDWEETP
jgi:polar amino acid transport system substrate-binding protein